MSFAHRGLLCECWHYGQRNGVIRQLQEALEQALIDVSGAVDPRGLKICLSSGHDSEHLGRDLRYLVSLTEGTPFCPGISEQAGRANLAANCLLLAKAYDAACKLELYMSEHGLQPYRGMTIGGNGGW